MSLPRSQRDMFDVLDQLIGPLNAHISGLIVQPVSGTDDELARADTKKAYLALLNQVVSSGLQGIFVSDREYSVVVSVNFELKLCVMQGIKHS